MNIQNKKCNNLSSKLLRNKKVSYGFATVHEFYISLIMKNKKNRRIRVLIYSILIKGFVIISTVRVFFIIISTLKISY